MAAQSATVADLQVIATIGWGAAIALAVAVHLLFARIDHGCDSCAHCADRREAEEARRAAEEERRFGRRLTPEELAQRIEEASRHADGDEDET